MSMRRPAVFFDRDNTLIACDDYLGDPAQVALLPGAAAAVARARRLGYATIVVSNQSGVARGMFDESAVQAVNHRLDELLLADDPAAVIDRHEYCPFHPEAKIEQYRQDSDLRKPKPGMIFQAAEKLALDLRRSWLIGDAARDIEAGKAAGCRTILFTDPNLPPSPAAEENGRVKADFSAASLMAAIDFIEANPEPPMPAEAANVAIASALNPGPTLSIAPAVQPQSAPRPQPQRPQTAPQIRPTDSQPRPQPTSTAASRVEALLDQMLTEIRRQNSDEVEFSVSKLLAGIVQVLAIAVMFLAYLYRGEPVETFVGLLLFAIFLQVMTIALLIMGKQR